MSLLRALGTPAYLLKAILRLLRESLEPFSASWQRPFAGIATHIVQKCIYGYERWACVGDRGYIRGDFRGLLPWAGSCSMNIVEGFHAVSVFDCELLYYWHGSGSRREKTVLPICTNLTSMGQMRNNLSARAWKPRNSKSFFRIWADISLPDLMADASTSPRTTWYSLFFHRAWHISWWWCWG